MNGQLPKHEYPAAGGIVIDEAGQHVLVLLRPGRLGPAGRPEVRLPKGHIEPGESRQQAAVREVCEEAGLCDLEIRADLGHQIVEFDWNGSHYVRDESYFLMTLSAASLPNQAEPQFQRLWLTWDQARSQLTFETERQWLQRAQAAASKT